MLAPHRVARLISLVLAAFVGACGGNSGGGGGGGGGGGAGDACEMATDCQGNQVCDPQSDTCNGDVSCSEHPDCGAVAYCDNGTCAPNATGGPCVDDVNCPVDDTCVGGYCGCDGAAFQAEPVTPNVLIVLDRSGSMADDLNEEEVGGDDPDSKWYIARTALEEILTNFGDQVRFGLVMYSSDGDCGPGEIEVGIDDGTADMIKSSIQSADPDGSTPIGDTLDGLIGYEGLADTSRPNYILLVTDGEERCDGDSVGAAADLRAQSPEVRTFVIGFGGAVDEESLNDTAVEGGTALPDDPQYYQADDAMQLGEAFSSIIGSVLSCTYELSSTPADVSQLWVYADGVPVPLDTSQTDGWDYAPDSNTVTFYGPACTALQTGEVTDLAIVYGCPGAPIE